MHSTSQINNGIYYSMGMLELELENEPRRWFRCIASFTGEPVIPNSSVHRGTVD